MDILDLNQNPLTGFTGLSTCQVTKGVYKCDINNLTAKNKKLIYDYYKIDFKLLKYKK